MTDDDLQRTLAQIAGQFDRSEYERRAYLAILDGGAVTAAEIAREADIPQPRVYDTVRSLSEAGLVELQETRPMKVLPIAPTDAVGGVQSTLDDLVDDLATRYSAPAREDTDASLVKSRSTIMRYLGEVIDAAEYELLVSLSPSLCDRFADELAAARDAGVVVDLLLSPARDVPDAVAHDYRDVADTVRIRRGSTTPIVAVADGRSAIYATRAALQGTDGGSRYGVIFDRAELGFLASGFFNTVLWATADPVTATDATLTFPRRYATMRRCVGELQSVEEPLYAAVRGRDVETGERRSLDGEIVEIVAGPNREIATLVVDAADGPVEVGGELASFEEVEAHEIVVDRDGPPANG